MEEAQRLKQIPPYLFAEINRKIEAAKAKGMNVISLGIGDPDMPTPPTIIDAMKNAVDKPENHRYPDYEGMFAFRDAIAKWYMRRHGVSLNPDKEILTLIGAKEGSLHLSLSYVNPGDSVLVPDPAYTTYLTSTILANGTPHKMLLKEENDFLPDLNAIPKDVAKKSKIIYLNYPNNPTTAVADKDHYRQVIDFAKDNDIIVCSDNPYSEIGFDGYKPLSFLEIPGARDVGIEFNSLSKNYNMTGWRIGMAVGNEEIIQTIGRVKTNIDSGAFNAVQQAGIAALNMPDSHLERTSKIYQRRRDVVIEALRSISLQPNVPKATIYVWTKVPENLNDADFASELIEKAGVVVAPGSSYGTGGKGYFRISLTVNDELLEEAVNRIKTKINP